jgi:hypothetical protein
MWIGLAVGLAVALIGLGSAAAQTREDITRCRLIEDGERRLACYDAIRVTPSAAAKYEAVAIDEMKEYALSYRGRLVEVAGWLTPDGGYLRLGLDAEDARPIPVDAEALTRSKRAAIAELCGAGCQATVFGRVRPVNFTTGVVADDIVVH